MDRNGELRRYHQLLQHLLVAGNEPVLTFVIIFFAKDLFILVMVSIVQGPVIIACSLWKSQKQQWLGEVFVMRDSVVTPLVICP